MLGHEVGNARRLNYRPMLTASLSTTSSTYSFDQCRSASLRGLVEPVTPQDFVRFLLSWQRVDPSTRLSGPEGVAPALSVLEGFEAPAAAWETDILPARVEGYEPSFLDALCLAGKTVWFRFGYSSDSSVTYEGVYVDNVSLELDGIFFDAFESGNTSAWTQTKP